MKCPVCGGAELVHDTRDVPYTYRGQSTVFMEVTGEFCPACDEVLLGGEHAERYSDLVGQFHDQVKAGEQL